MAEKAIGFIPHSECMVASGDCFRLSKCLSGCKDRSFYQHQADLKHLNYRITQLELRLMALEKPATQPQGKL